jgi:predicted metalloenzyme YecM
MDYQELYNKASQELEEIKVKKAMASSKISELTDKLGLDSSSDIESQCVALKKSTEEKLESLKTQIEECLTKLKAYGLPE